MAEDEDQNAKAGDSKEDRAARMNSAKAFYRAMYAGAEPDPEEFSLDLGAAKAQGGGNDDMGNRGGGGDMSAVLHLQDQLKETEAKALEYENLYKRIIADFDNYKKRMDRERDEMQTIGMQKALEAILPGLDDLDMAQSKLTETTEPKVMIQSFKMILARFSKCLEQVGIKQMQVIGEPFDPRFHEPIQEVHTAEFPEGAVVQQLRPGYIMGEKVLRPTLVNVATAPLDGPGYQPPAAAEQAAAAGDDAASVEAAPVGKEAEAPGKKVEVTEEDVIAASQDYKSGASYETSSAAGADPDTKPDPKPDGQSELNAESQPESKAASGGVEGESDTSDALNSVDNQESAQQYATQDIPLKEFKASLEAEAVAAGSDKAKDRSGESKAEEAVASSEEG